MTKFHWSIVRAICAGSVLLAASALLYSCGGNTSSTFESAPDAPAYNSGGVPWSDIKKDCPDDNKGVSPVPTNPTPTPAPSDSADEEVCWWCRTFPWWPGCVKANPPKDNIPNVPGTPNTGNGGSGGPGGSCGGGAIQDRNTDFCAIDAAGNVLTADRVSAQDGDRIFGVAGGCVARPIREVWAALMNYDTMRSPDVNEYRISGRPDLVDPSRHLLVVWDISNVHIALGGIVKPQWLVRWYYALTYGTTAAPLQVLANYQKVEGTDYISHLSGGYVLDRVSENMTSFVVTESVKAAQTDTNRIYKEVSDVLGKIRSAAPNWDALPQ